MTQPTRHHRVPRTPAPPEPTARTAPHTSKPDYAIDLWRAPGWWATTFSATVRAFTDALLDDGGRYGPVEITFTDEDRPGALIAVGTVTDLYRCDDNGEVVVLSDCWDLTGPPGARAIAPTGVCHHIPVADIERLRA